MWKDTGINREMWGNSKNKSQVIWRGGGGKKSIDGGDGAIVKNVKCQSKERTVGKTRPQGGEGVTKKGLGGKKSRRNFTGAGKS